MATIKSFQDLEIWQLSRRLENEIYILCTNSTLSKDFELRNQMSRSCGSIMDNIAEGFGRGGRNEFIQFLSIARASSSELQSQLVRCLDRRHIEEEQYKALQELTLLVGNKIGALMRYLQSNDMKGQKFNNRVAVNNNVTENTKHQTPNNAVHTENAAKPLGAYPHARRVGNLLFLSGIGSRSANDNSIPGLVQSEVGEIVSYDIEAECHSVFANVKAVLEASGSSWDSMVDVTVFLTNMKEDFPIYNKIYGEYFKDVQACRTTVEVRSLPTPIAIELKVIATID